MLLEKLFGLQLTWLMIYLDFRKRIMRDGKDLENCTSGLLTIEDISG